MPTTAGAAGSMHAVRRIVLAAALVWSAALGAHAAPPIDDFFKLPLVHEARLSPSGRYLAMLVGGAANARARLGVVDLDERDKPPKIVASFVDADVTRVQWLDDQRLIFGASDNDAPADRRRARGLWAVDRDGSAMRHLIHREWVAPISEGNSRIERRILEPNHHLHSVVNDGSGDVLVLKRRWDAVGDDQNDHIFRLDTRTGFLRRITMAPDVYVHHWVVDAQGEPRAALSVSGGRIRLYWRAKGAAAWTMLSDTAGSFDTAALPLWVDGDTLYVSAVTGPQGLSALYRYDFAAKRPEAQPLFAIEG